MPGDKTAAGRRLRAARDERGWSREVLAKRLRSASRRELPAVASLAHMIKEWEAGKHGVSDRYQALYCQVFGMPRAELFGEHSAATSPWRTPGVDLNGALTPDHEVRLIAAARAPRHHDPRVVDALAAVLSGQRHTEDVVGSAPLIEPVKAQLLVVESLVAEARGDLRMSVLDLGSQWAQFAGWLHANTGHFDAANQWYDRAITWATESGSPDMIATALNMRGHVAWLTGHIGPMATLSQAAQRDPNTSPGVRAMAAQQEARSHAIAGPNETYAMDAKLDESAELATRAAEQPDDEPPWMYFYSPLYLTMQRGLAYRLIGTRNTEAVELLSQGINGLPEDTRNTEWTAFYVYELAKTYVAAGDVAEACVQVQDAVSIARQTSSERLMALLGSLHQRMSRNWPDHPAVGELLDVLH